MSHSHSALAVPEILLIIGSFMTKPSLAISLRVSRFFRQTLERLLYAELILVSGSQNRPSIATVQSHVHYIRHLKTRYFISVEYLTLDFQHLTSISLEGQILGFCDYEEEEEEWDRVEYEPMLVGSHQDITGALEALVRNNPKLRRWIIREPVPSIETSLWKAIAQGHQQLQHDTIAATTQAAYLSMDSAGSRLDLLDLTFVSIYRKSIPYFLATCRSTRHLRISHLTVLGLYDFPTMRYDPPSHDDTEIAGTCYFPQTVDWIDVSGLSLKTQFEFFARCTDLQEIKWEIRKRKDPKAPNRPKESKEPLPDINDICHLIKPGAWMHLRSLTLIINLGASENDCLMLIPDKGFAHILETIPAQQLQVLRLLGTAFGSSGLQALKRHCDSLEHLEIRRTKIFTSVMLQKTLEEFPRLTTLKAGTLWASDIEQGRPWVCLGLKELKIQFNTRGVEEVPDDQRYHRLVIDRLSTLVDLERLDMNAGYGSNLLSLRLRLAYGLDSLVTLKNLTSLDVYETFQDFELDDIRWMCAHWPKLAEIRGDLHSDGSQHNLILSYLKAHNIDYEWYPFSYE
ncbi:hypothetical protein FBU30_005498 [Linnemannia zychae]|nr:hypothetical protein FBU30_005498 [Linnemannia zychae]